MKLQNRLPLVQETKIAAAIKANSIRLSHMLEGTKLLALVPDGERKNLLSLPPEGRNVAFQLMYSSVQAATLLKRDRGYLAPTDPAVVKKLLNGHGKELECWDMSKQGMPSPLSDSEKAEHLAAYLANFNYHWYNDHDFEGASEPPGLTRNAIGFPFFISANDHHVLPSIREGTFKGQVPGVAAPVLHRKECYFNPLTSTNYSKPLHEFPYLSWNHGNQVEVKVQDIFSGFSAADAEGAKDIGAGMLLQPVPGKDGGTKHCPMPFQAAFRFQDELLKKGDVVRVFEPYLTPTYVGERAMRICDPRALAHIEVSEPYAVKDALVKLTEAAEHANQGFRVDAMLKVRGVLIRMKDKEKIIESLHNFANSARYVPETASLSGIASALIVLLAPCQEDSWVSYAKFLSCSSGSEQARDAVLKVMPNLKQHLFAEPSTVVSKLQVPSSMNIENINVASHGCLVQQVSTMLSNPDDDQIYAFGYLVELNANLMASIVLQKALSILAEQARHLGLVEASVAYLSMLTLFFKNKKQLQPSAATVTEIYTAFVAAKNRMEGAVKDVEVKPVPGKGIGLFAKRAFKAGECIAEGNNVTANDLDTLPCDQLLHETLESRVLPDGLGLQMVMYPLQRAGIRAVDRRCCAPGGSIVAKQVDSHCLNAAGGSCDVGEIFSDGRLVPNIRVLMGFHEVFLPFLDDHLPRIRNPRIASTVGINGFNGATKTNLVPIISMCNHAEDKNADSVDCRLTAMHDIEVGDEICISYINSSRMLPENQPLLKGWDIVLDRDEEVLNTLRSLLEDFGKKAPSSVGWTNKEGRPSKEFLEAHTATFECAAQSEPTALLTFFGEIGFSEESTLFVLNLCKGNAKFERICDGEMKLHRESV